MDAGRMLANTQINESTSIGDLVAGKYRIERVIGEGGMARVVAARHIELDELVAIKFLLPAALNNPDVVTRFAQEARASVKIKSEHVARILDVSTLENGAPYMVMEYLDGIDLSTMLQRQGALPIEQAVEFVLQASEAIAEAHGLGMVHRDLKPANLFCIRRPDGIYSVKVLDFGISKVKNAKLSSASAAMTSAIAVLGSPYYMSPEQLRSSYAVDARADIWSLGVILFELMTGRVPFEGETLPELYINIAAQRAPLARKYRSEIPKELEKIIRKCLMKDRSDRYSNIAELAIALAPFGPKRSRDSIERISGIIRCSGISAYASALPPLSQNPPSLADARTQADWSSSYDPNRRGRRGVLAFAATTVLVAIGLSLWLYQRSASNAFIETSNASVLDPTTPTLQRDAASVAPFAAVAPALRPARETTPQLTAVPSTVLTFEPLVGQAPGTSAKRQSGGLVAPTETRTITRKSANARAIVPDEDCNPPFYFEAGIKVYKRGCL